MPRDRVPDQALSMLAVQVLRYIQRRKKTLCELQVAAKFPEPLNHPELAGDVPLPLSDVALDHSQFDSSSGGVHVSLPASVRRERDRSLSHPGLRSEPNR